MYDLFGKVNSGSSFFAFTFLHMHLYAETGHKTEPGIAMSGVSKILSPSCIVLDHLIQTIK